MSEGIWAFYSSLITHASSLEQSDMGKAQIISNIGEGQYSVKLLLEKSRITTRITELDAMIANITTRINALEDGPEKTRLKLAKTSFEKQKQFLEDNMPEDPVMNAWCADLTDDLTGIVGTVEVPGERGEVQIQPGYGGNAVYNASRDGQLQPVIAASPWAAFYNRAMFPGWQKWKPTFRYGTIISVNDNLCDVSLEDAESSARGLDVNQTSYLSDVPIDYMDCNGQAFEAGDSVLVMFTGQDWANPKVIGFREDPKPCSAWEEPWGTILCENHVWDVVPFFGDGVDHGVCPTLPIADYIGGASIIEQSGLSLSAGKLNGYCNLSLLTSGISQTYELTASWRRTANTKYPDPIGTLEIDLTATLVGRASFYIKMKWIGSSTVVNFNLAAGGKITKDLKNYRPGSGGEIEFISIWAAVGVGPDNGGFNYSGVSFSIDSIKVIG